jgi:hypothetical protein
MKYEVWSMKKNKKYEVWSMKYEVWKNDSCQKMTRDIKMEKWNGNIFKVSVRNVMMV